MVTLLRSKPRLPVMVRTRVRSSDDSEGFTRASQGGRLQSTWVADTGYAAFRVGRPFGDPPAAGLLWNSPKVGMFCSTQLVLDSSRKAQGFGQVVAG